MNLWEPLKPVLSRDDVLYIPKDYKLERWIEIDPMVSDTMATPAYLTPEPDSYLVRGKGSYELVRSLQFKARRNKYLANYETAWKKAIAAKNYQIAYDSAQAVLLMEPNNIRAMTIISLTAWKLQRPDLSIFMDKTLDAYLSEKTLLKTAL